MRAKRRDANHGQIADHLRRIGFGVHDTATLGDGFPDLLIYRPGFAALVEVKDGSKPPSARKLTRDEVKFQQEYTGPYAIVLDPIDAEKKLTALWRKHGRT